MVGWLGSHMDVILGVLVAVAAIAGFILLGATLIRAVGEADERREQAREQARIDQAARAAAAERKREEQQRKDKQRRVDMYGVENAARIESAFEAVRQVAASEAAREGWLGDVDFSSEIFGITSTLEKAHQLRTVADELAVLDKPSADDKRILAEASSTIKSLERAAIERVELIEKCAEEAQFIDRSLQNERRDAKVAEQRAELHAKLSATLYGVDAAPDITPQGPEVDAVLARVAAYRDIKNQIHLAPTCPSDL
ncbi:hypothetical protein [Mycolicibacterium rhodesiae]|uniref:Uncharacterized protein n=1 Tax=Mycolicibacterium rhodesiae TaxID=36814 RepID=A0A1X0J5D8_MYCRH|nr:hypothetical protein [Mycolicibacterium rhodesiae]ORB57244.1 hypothetical protein BST42_02245 [Mycolicibacterium rhodesiae]